jgi:CheY-like chemotaxis protein
MLTILAVGEDFDLLRTRAEILSKTGANVLCSSGVAALKFIAEWEFDLIVLGHSVRQQHAKQITEAAHRRGSKTLVLLLVLDESQEHAYDGINLDGRSFVEPGCLIRSASQLLERQQGPRPSGVTLKMSTNSLAAKKRPASYPADISVRRAQITQFENRRAG